MYQNNFNFTGNSFQGRILGPAGNGTGLSISPFGRVIGNDGTDIGLRVDNRGVFTQNDGSFTGLRIQGNGNILGAGGAGWSVCSPRSRATSD